MKKKVRGSNIKNIGDIYKCPYCNCGFRLSATLYAHKCHLEEKKRREMD